MAGEASVFQTGGGGFHYENYVQSAFVLSMIINGNIPVFPNGKVVEVGFQNRNKGYQTDDLFLKVKEDKSESRVIAQIKYNIPVSEKNNVFLEVIEAFWKDFNNAECFDKEQDKMFLIKSSLTNNDKNHIVYLCQLASKQANEKDFFSEVDRIKIKKETLNIFVKSITSANGKDISDKDLWEFLKCFHLLSYDFTLEASVDESYMLNLIKLSKSSNIETTPKEIWSVLLNEVNAYNRNGGAITKSALKKFQPYNYFDLSKIHNAYEALKKVEQDGLLLLKPFKNTISGYHIDRSLIKKSIYKSVNESNITIITGYPGVGKSSIVKDILESEFIDSFPIIFKADQLNKTSLAQVFSEVGISHNLTDLFSLISLLPNKIIIIDSAEKLLEGQPDSAFKQLLATVEESVNIKLILTCRSYAVNVIKQKFGIPSNKINVVDIPILGDNEISFIKKEFPQLNNLFLNKKINEILRSPKYLDFTISSINENDTISEDISLIEFKEKLWNEIIENSSVTLNGLPRKRSSSFTHLAVGRAESMRLFFEPDDKEIDYEAINQLESENIIIRNNTKFEFSPSHDILEDWALVKHIAKIENKLSDKTKLFLKLGSQPALRRAFRLWIEELLTYDIDRVASLISLTLNEESIPIYWTDEILTAVFRSDDCQPFFEYFTAKLLDDNCVFLNRCILIIRTTCREYSFNKGTSKDILFPVGSCWVEILNFLVLHISKIENLRKSISNLLLDWEYKYLFQFQHCSSREIAAANILTFHYVEEMASNVKYWYSFRNDNVKTNFVYMLFGFAPYCSEQLKTFIENCSTKTNEYGSLEGFNRLVIKKVLGGVRNRSLIIALPETLIKIANVHWKHTPPIEKPKRNNRFGFQFPENKERDDAWGITKNRFDFFPSGIYKTFVFSLLQNHPNKAIFFICSFTNYITSSYKDSDYSKKEDLKKIKINLNNGKENIQYGNEYLWNAYRGTTVTHYLLESILISLEKSLLDIAQFDISENKLLKSITTYLLENSNSVAVTSVITSVFIAHPKPFEDTILPILKIKEFYEWDTNRATREHSATAIYDSSISYAQKEKGQFNNLPHRKKYVRGLREFILHYQLEVGLLNDKLHKIFDQFYTSCGQDIFWEKAINEMDIRKYKASIVDKEKGVFQLEVNYPKPVQNAVENFTLERKGDELSLNYSHIIRQAKEGKQNILFDEWTKIFNYFSSNEVNKTMWDSPVTLSVLGLNLFYENLNSVQKEFCIKTILETIENIIIHTNDRGSFNSKIGYNIMEQQLTLESIHLLYKFRENFIEEKEIDIAIIYLIISPLADHQIKDFQKYFRNIFSKEFPQKAREIIFCLIRYSKFPIENKFNYYGSQEEIKKFKEKQFEFIVNTLSENSLPEINSLDFDSYEAHFLNNSLFLINSDTNSKFFQDYILKVCQLILEDLKVGDDYSYSRSRKSRKTNYKILINLRFYFNEILLFNNLEYTKLLIDKLSSPFLVDDFEIKYSEKDMYELVTGIFNTIVTRLDDIIIEKNEVEKYVNHFWNLWKYFFDKIKKAKSSLFRRELLLDVNESHWSIKSNEWQGLQNHKNLYNSITNYFGYKSLSNIIKVYSTFGEKIFLPLGINLIVKFLKENTDNINYLDTQDSVKLIEVLFNNHIKEIKENQVLVEDFIYILNKMVELGYCEAYLIRECVIVYKTSA